MLHHEEKGVLMVISYKSSLNFLQSLTIIHPAYQTNLASIGALVLNIHQKRQRKSKPYHKLFVYVSGWIGSISVSLIFIRSLQDSKASCEQLFSGKVIKLAKIQNDPAFMSQGQGENTPYVCN